EECLERDPADRRPDALDEDVEDAPADRWALPAVLLEEPHLGKRRLPRPEHAMRARDDLGLAAAAADRAELPAGRVDQHAGSALARRRAAVAHDVCDRHRRGAREAPAQLVMEREGVLHGRTLPHPQIASRAAAPADPEAR